MIEPSLGLAADDVGVPPLFFRSADRLRLEGCVAGLLRDGRSLALSSTRDGALDHYSRILIARLRESAPQSPPEVYFPADTAAMISRFNEAVAAMSLQEAMQAGPQAEPARIWIVHDAGALANHEVQLLARLIQNFPGANIRVVLLLGPSAQSRKLFETLDRRLLRWDIEAPTPEQAQAMLEQGREDGCEGAVRSLLKKLEAPAPGAAAEADPAGIDPLGFESPGKGRAVVAGKAADVFKFSAGTDAPGTVVKTKAQAKAEAKAQVKAQVKSSSGKGGRLRAFLSWLLILGALASLSVGVTAWLHPTVFTLDRLALAQRWAMNLAATAMPAATSSPVVPVVPVLPVVPVVPVESVTPVAPPAESAVPAGPVEPASALAAAAPVLPASAAAATAAPAPAVPVVPIIPAAAPGTAASAAAEVEPPSEALAGQAWLQPMPFGTWVVQHAAMPSYQAALKWQQATPLLAQARIVALYRPNDKLAYFAVVSGPFTSRVQATEFTARKGMPAEAWIRPARTLREQFSPSTSGTAPSKPQESRR